MPQLVTVKPKPGSRRFTVQGNITQYNKTSDTPMSSEVQPTGNFKGERFPNSRQPKRVKWSNSKRRWLLAGAPENSKGLNRLVEQCKLKYEDDHPRKGEYITECDIFDREDPFLTHSKMKMIAREGEFVLDKDHPKDKILIMAIQAQHDYEVDGVSKSSTRTRYIITDKNIDKRAKQKMRKQETQAIELYMQMNPKKRMQIAMAMGLIANENADQDVIDDVLYAAVKDTSTKSQGKSKQEYFIALAQTDDVDVKIRFMIQKARATGYLKKVKDIGWTIFGQPVGKTDAQVYAHFRNPENQSMLTRLNEALEEDKMPEYQVRKPLEDQLNVMEHEEEVKEVKKPPKRKSDD